MQPTPADFWVRRAHPLASPDPSQPEGSSVGRNGTGASDGAALTQEQLNGGFIAPSFETEFAA
jgi:hypothetical protein